MNELEKLDAGLEYDFMDPAVAARKNAASIKCAALNALAPDDAEGRTAAIKGLFGSTGEEVFIEPGFHCDNGKNIHVGEGFLCNYNVTILDIMPVKIGDHVMIGPGTLISTVNHPMVPSGRRKFLGQGKPVTIGDDVWMGGNVTVLPGVTIGNNVVVAAGAVVTKDVPDNSLVAGVPAKVIRELEDDIER